MPGCHADKASEGTQCTFTQGPLASGGVGGHRGVARTGDQGAKPGGYTWVDTVSLMLLMDCPTGAPADWHQAQRSSTG